MNELEVRCNLLLEVEECRLLELVIGGWVCLCWLNIVIVGIWVMPNTFIPRIMGLSGANSYRRY